MSLALVKFLGLHVGEMLSVASALTDIADGLALRPAEAANVRAVIAKLQTGAVSIGASVKKLEKAPVVKIQKKDIEEAVAAALPALIEKAVADALAKVAEKEASDIK